MAMPEGVASFYGTENRTRMSDRIGMRMRSKCGRTVPEMRCDVLPEMLVASQPHRKNKTRKHGSEYGKTPKRTDSHR